MVRALIEGKKTQTRRIIKPQPFLGCAGETPYFSWNGFTGLWPDDWQIAIERNIRIAVGDRLWVRESVTRFDKGTCDQHVWYRAGHNTSEFYQMIIADIAGRSDGEWPHVTGPAGGAPYKVPSIHMPRWASRLTLAVTGVKVERLQEISDRGPHNDCIAEGMFASQFLGSNANWAERGFSSIEKSRYHDLWELINGEGSWRANPLVVAYTFSVIKRNIDDIERAAA